MTTTIETPSPIQPVALLTAEFTVSRPPTATKESYYDTTGYRPSFPLLVYAVDVMDATDTFALQVGQAFVVSPLFSENIGDAFFDQGAAPNAIGTKNLGPNSQIYYSFRQPVLWETVWVVPLEGMWRFEYAYDTAVYSWQAYASMPERAYAGMALFSIFDPDKVLLYYLKVVGACLTEWQYDNDIIRQQYDAYQCAPQNLISLAANYGLALDTSDPLTVQRSKVKNIVSVWKQKGLPSSVVTRLSDFGYLGYATEVWVDPGDPTIELVTAVGTPSTLLNVPITATGSVIGPFGMDGADLYNQATGYVVFQNQANPAVNDIVSITLPVSVSGITRSYAAETVTATVTTVTPHGLVTGTSVQISGALPSSYNGAFVITVTGANTFTYTFVLGVDPGAVTGTIFELGAVAFTFIAGSATAPQVQINATLATTVANFIAALTTIYGSLLTVTNITAFKTFGPPIRNQVTSSTAYGTRAFATFPSSGITRTFASAMVTATVTVASIAVSGITSAFASGVVTATVTTTSAHGLTSGQTAAISGATPIAYNGNYLVAVTGPTTFTYVFAAATDPGVVTGSIIVNPVHGLMSGQTVAIDGASPAAYNGKFTVSVISPTVFTYQFGASGDPGAVSGTITVTTFGDRYREYFHGYWSKRIPIFFPSSRVAIHLNNPDGSPLAVALTPQASAAMLAIKKQIANDLQFGVLPAHVDVAWFDTDLNVPSPLAPDAAYLDEQFVITTPITATPPPGMLVWLRSGTAVPSGSTINWPDSSGNGNNGVGTGTLNAVTGGGITYVGGFDSASRVALPYNFQDADGWHIYVVCTLNAYSASNVVLGADGRTDPSVLGVSMRVGDAGTSGKARHTAGVYGSGGTEADSADVVPLSQLVLVDGGFNPLTNITCKLNSDGEQSAVWTYGDGHGTTLGVWIGSDQLTPSDFFHGTVTEVLIYPPSQDPAAVRAYILARFGIVSAPGRPEVVGTIQAQSATMSGAVLNAGAMSAQAATVSGTGSVNETESTGTLQAAAATIVGSGTNGVASLPSGAALLLTPASIVSSLGVVTGWNDLSGNGNDLTAVGALTLGSIGGNDAVGGFATGTGLTSASTAVPLSTTGFTILAVFESTASPSIGNNILVWAGDLISGQFIAQITAGFNSPSTFIETDYMVDGQSAPTPSVTAANTPTVIYGVQGSGTLTVQQAGDTAASAGYGPSHTSSGRVVVGNLDLTNSSGADPFFGLVSAVVIYQRELTPTELIQAMSYLSQFA